MIKVSVIVPVFNVEKYLSQCLDSILNQSLKEIEVICINDGSTDSSLDILNRYKSKDKRIKVISQSNGGPGNARNVAMDNAKGEFITFIDSDDYFSPNALELAYNVSKGKNADFTLFKSLKLDDKTNETSPIKYFDMPFLRVFGDATFNHEDVGERLFDISVTAHGKLFRRDFINKLRFPENIIFEDNPFILEALFMADKLYFLDEYLYIKRIHNDSITQSYFSEFSDCIEIFNQMADITKKYGEYDKYKEKLFIKKVLNIYTRFTQVSEGYKSEFFSKIQNDFKSKREEFERTLDFDIVRPRAKHIFYSALESRNYQDFEESVNSFKKDTKKISILIPVYNAHEFLYDSIPSLLNQTFDNIELICVNDGSKDDSLDILNEFAAKDSRIKVIDKENGGCGSARNRALEEATGEYIYFFDPDDRILPETLNEAYASAVANESDVVVFKGMAFNDEGFILKKQYFNYSRYFGDIDFSHFTFNYKDAPRIVLNDAIAPWAKLYKKEFIDGYDDFRFDLGIAFDDVPFHVKTMLRAKRISFIDKVLYHYRVNNPNSVNNTSSNGFDIFKIFNIVEGILKGENCFDDFKFEFYQFVVDHAKIYMISTNSEEYFKLAKAKLLEIDEKYVENFPKNIKNQYFDIMTSEKLTDYILLVKNREISSLEKKISKLKKENKKLKKTNNDMVNSRSWKITEPIRGLKRHIK